MKRLTVYGTTRVARIPLGVAIYVAAANKLEAAKHLHVSAYNLDQYPAPAPDTETVLACLRQPGTLVKGASVEAV